MWSTFHYQLSDCHDSRRRGSMSLSSRPVKPLGYRGKGLSQRKFFRSFSVGFSPLVVKSGRREVVPGEET